MPPSADPRPAFPSALRLIVALLLAGIGMLLEAPAASGHGFSSVVYAEATQQDGAMHVDLALEYDLLVVSVAENQDDPDLFEDGMAVWKTGEEEAALQKHADSLVDYVAERFRVEAAGVACAPVLDGEPGATIRQDVPYATLPLRFDCPSAGSYVFTSGLFPDDEGYVTGTVTLLDYDLSAARTGNVSLDAQTPSFDTSEPVLERMWRFLVLGAEHLLFGIDHILFLLALIVGSWRLRDIVLAATAFTVAHSVTFILAALGVVSLPDAIVEPVIAFSIAVVAIWYLWRVWLDRRSPDAGVERTRKKGHDAADTARLVVVFAFGLMHGLGFAGALGIDEPFSWGLLGSLLVFNVGLEIAQVAIIVVVFPLLLMLRRRAPRAGLVVGVLVAAGVAVMGLIWFVERLLALG
jgi:hypothetical protein